MKKKSERSFQITPEQLAACLLLGYSFYENGRNQEARKIFEGVKHLAPGNPYPLAVLGAIHQREGDYDKAIACYSDALALNGRDIQTLTNRGECYLQTSRFEQAAVDLQKAIGLDPEKKNPAATRARLLVAMTVEGLKLASEEGIDAVREAKERIDAQLTT